MFLYPFLRVVKKQMGPKKLISGIQPNLLLMTLDKHEIQSQLIRRPSLTEVFSFTFGIAMASIFIWLHRLGLVVLYDFENYLKAANSNYANYYYGYWILPIFLLLSKLPFYFSYLIWVTINLLGVFFAARSLGGKPALVMITYQMLYGIYYGQIIGVIAGGLGLMWLGLIERKWWIAGLGLLLAGAKLQSGLIIALMILLFANTPWKEKIKVIIFSGLFVVLSLALYPGWPLDLYLTIVSNPANADGSISLWRWFGPYALLLLIPPLIIRTSKENRFLMVLSAIPLSIPYFQQADLITLMVFPIGWLATFAGNISFSYIFLGYTGLQMSFIVPLGLYLYAIFSELVKYLRNKNNILHITNMR